VIMAITMFMGRVILKSVKSVEIMDFPFDNN